ncbi:Acetyltransferase (GNAT) family protein [Marinomonas spartinae]|uniref:GNAT family N-acetyltransferase n=1 Tax=Marinomonas spartinae TaxID=1792290 RepID=UPI000809115E|nr:GNAT family N-acetyltransferase [Marinomonas spartinae]SBS39507.1 Acetyltransferase (GNAT) family protein [Marinomonas spartinae]
MNVEVTTQPDPSDIDEIRAGLRKHNSPFLGDVYHTDVACYLYDEHGKKLGGLVGEIWGHWLMVKFLWVDEHHLNKGLGRQLLNKAEEFARSKGCQSSFLDTFSFQAKPFYEKQGYSVQMTLNNFPIESRR